ncbi:toxin-antitoxin system YwqK family antitoxin [Lewinella sp. IMCC34183]|uniref:toxin-antitoxin system YwqK family antitoxin n=1 Tax=Lewinella sp. IMCC34183 TaxID=2248762 RepID=UPI0013006297|nr:toxin-antitoxin system YwqK family antitoxin [Lewinella sp. IMCC34183]
MLTRALTALLLATLLCTCGPALEDREETDALGFRTEYQVSPETGEREGSARRYGPDGNLIAEETYAGGQLDGARTAYYPDGKVELIETYDSGRFEGPYTTYDSTGNLRLRGEYVAGAMAKAWTRYWPNGSVREVVTFADNKENGPFREWYANGQPRAAGAYADGREQGTLWQYDETGTLTTVRDCQAGICTALWRAEEGGTPPFPPPNMTRPADAGTTN